MIYKKSEHGFTLIEILLVIAILAVLAAVIIPAAASRTEDARIKSDRINTELLQGALETYYRHHGEYPLNPENPGDNGFYANDRKHDLVTRGYLNEIPASPFDIDPGYEIETGVVKSLAEGVYYNK